MPSFLSVGPSFSIFENLNINFGSGENLDERGVAHLVATQVLHDADYYFALGPDTVTECVRYATSLRKELLNVASRMTEGTNDRGAYTSFLKMSKACGKFTRCHQNETNQQNIEAFFRGEANETQVDRARSYANRVIALRAELLTEIELLIEREDLNLSCEDLDDLRAPLDLSAYGL